MSHGVPAGANFFLRNPLPQGAYDAMDEEEAMEVPVQRGALMDDDVVDADGNPIIISEELGEHGPRFKCFACMYVGQDRAAKIPDQRLAGIFQLMADGIGESWPPALAVQVAKQYEAWRKIVNATRGERDKLPRWTAAQVLDHWYHHTCDPEIQQWLHLTWIQYSIDKIRQSGLERLNKVTGEVRHDPQQFAMMLNGIRTWYTISAKDPRKHAYFKESAMINRPSLSNGGFSKRKRPVMDCFSGGKRQRIAGKR